MKEKIKVLMVDDEEQFRSTTSRLLSKRGYETTVAGSGEEAIEILEKDLHDVVVLDIRMPGMDGHQALARIKEINPDIQVIMLTGHGAEESARESLKKGAFDYLNKPCDIDLLMTRVKDAVRVGDRGVQEEKKAGDIMVPIAEYTTIDPGATIKEGIERLTRSFRSAVSTSRLMETGHRSIIVFGQAGEMVGILSILDLIRELRPSYLSAPKPSMADSMEYSPMFWSGLFTAQAKKLANMKVGDVMSDAPPVMDEQSNLMEIADLIYEKEIRRVAVTRVNKVVGVIREQDIFFELSRTLLGA
jgi:CheY-like chemotaxis protein